MKGSDGIQIAFRLDKQLYDNLKQAGGNVSEEIRRRLEGASPDERTRVLQGAIGRIADTIGTFYEPWHEDRFAFEVLKSAVETLLAYRRPQGEPVPKPNPALDILGEGDPAQIGRGLALSELHPRS
jgi:hypothetical protein